MREAPSRREPIAGRDITRGRRLAANQRSTLHLRGGAGGQLGLRIAAAAPDQLEEETSDSRAAAGIRSAPVAASGRKLRKKAVGANRCQERAPEVHEFPPALHLGLSTNHKAPPPALTNYGREGLSCYKSGNFIHIELYAGCGSGGTREKWAETITRRRPEGGRIA